MRVWNGSAWVSYGENDSSNTNTISVYNGSSWVRVTLNKTITNTSTLDYQYVTGQINTNTYGYFSNAKYYSSGGYYHLYRQFLGYVRVTASGNCRLWASWANGLGDTSTGYDDFQLISTGYMQYKGYYSSSTYTGWSYQTMSRNAWHYLNCTSGGVYNTAAANTASKYMRVSVDNGTVYNIRTANGGDSSRAFWALYAYWSTYARLGGTSTDFRGTITYKGACYTTTRSATIDVSSGTIGSKLNVGTTTNINGTTVRWISSNNNIVGVYNNTSTTS